ncbi:SGNH/GDSL hydrolase family protein [Sphingosinicella sp. LHD-64]|uniref:SGNH/GDSL hydrolase family protein n=1 Tax=Sphingosinicella sp. LHD-64 TaxID=3072139 RepID=UPI00280D4A3E|nr:SGNH/GDSL hydrolase family protein [Sphingosinicella sp. LHD-64]MDQ8755237.1 SGNH/GDSL hydrolase family protein [Sphingosinicella sp. LHD-64]
MMRWWLSRLTAVLLAASLGATPAAAQRWVGSWATSQQIPEPHNMLPDDQLRDMTLRQVVRLTLGGESIRVRLSNAFGTEPLAVDNVHVALSDGGGARIVAGTGRAVTFAGHRTVVIPAGADYLSDPVDLAVPALTSLAVTMHLPEPPARQTGHPGSRIDSWLLRGVHSDAVDLPGAAKIDHWYQLGGIDVEARGREAAIVLFGDSITDGYGVTGGANNRWPDFLAQRLQAAPQTRHLSVLNHGISGNRMLRDGLGPSALARFDRDVLSQAGVRYLVILEGVNDLGVLTRGAPATPEQHEALVRGVVGAYAQMVRRARERGIRVIGATILPFAGSDYYHPGPPTEASRQAINAWIRTPGNFDAVIDFDAAMRDPDRPDRIRPDYDLDGLHPSIAGYRAMADAVPLELFR